MLCQNVIIFGEPIVILKQASTQCTLSLVTTHYLGTVMSTQCTLSLVTTHYLGTVTSTQCTLSLGTTHYLGTVMSTQCTLSMLTHPNQMSDIMQKYCNGHLSSLPTYSSDEEDLYPAIRV